MPAASGETRPPTLVDNTSQVLPHFPRCDNLRTQETPRKCGGTRERMKIIPTFAAIVLSYLAAQAGSVAAVAQVRANAPDTSPGPTEAAKPGNAGGASSPDEMGNRRPLYRL